MNNVTPTNKVTAGLFAGAVTALAAYSMKTFAKVDMPAEIGAAISMVVTFVVQWLVPDSPQSPPN